MQDMTFTFTNAQAGRLADILGDEARRSETQAMHWSRKRTPNKADFVRFYEERAAHCRDLLKAMYPNAAA